MQPPIFSECSHPLVKSLVHYSDQELVTLLQRHPDSGQYFVALFCRYSSIVFSLIRHSARSPVQAEYLFAVTWRHIFHELRGLDLRQITPSKQFPSKQLESPNVGSTSKSKSKSIQLQSWLINVTAACINQAPIPPVESIHYSLADASPPLWCYVEQAIDRLPPMQRLMVLMTQTFHWSDTRIAAHLQAEGDRISASEVKEQLRQGYQRLEAALPDDIRTIYFTQIEHTLNGASQNTSHEADV
ncbi:MAG: RNA polymerase sigma factor [Elainellaceae cyanobacterium]